MAKLSVIIPAAGSGTRMGADVPKPLIELGGKTILEHTITRFLEVSEVIQIIIATPEAYVKKISALVSVMSSEVNFLVIEGGSERQFSIYNALLKVDEGADLVAVHDAVRPFIRSALIEKCMEVASQYDGAIIGVPAKDTIKRVNEDNVIQETPKRSLLWQAQTPQIFKKKVLQKAYEDAIDHNFVATDDASLVERIGGEVRMVEGDRENLKITYPVDLKVAELMLNYRK